MWASGRRVLGSRCEMGHFFFLFFPPSGLSHFCVVVHPQRSLYFRFFSLASPFSYKKGACWFGRCEADLFGTLLCTTCVAPFSLCCVLQAPSTSANRSLTLQVGHVVTEIPGLGLWLLRSIKWSWWISNLIQWDVKTNESVFMKCSTVQDFVLQVVWELCGLIKCRRGLLKAVQVNLILRFH